MNFSRNVMKAALVTIAVLMMAVPVLAETAGSGSFKNDTEIELNFGVPVDESWAKNTSNYTVFEKQDPDIRINVDSVALGPQKVIAILKFKESLNLSKIGRAHV